MSTHRIRQRLLGLANNLDCGNQIIETIAADDIREAEQALGKLQAFKDYVHERLDLAGVPKEPNGEHSAAGCRVGDRLDILIGRLLSKAGGE